jgi:hypothetical protein
VELLKEYIRNAKYPGQSKRTLPEEQELEEDITLNFGRTYVLPAKERMFQDADYFDNLRKHFNKDLHGLDAWRMGHPDIAKTFGEDFSQARFYKTDPLKLVPHRIMVVGGDPKWDEAAIIDAYTRLYKPEDSATLDEELMDEQEGSGESRDYDPDDPADFETLVEQFLNIEKEEDPVKRTLPEEQELEDKKLEDLFAHLTDAGKSLWKAREKYLNSGSRYPMNLWSDEDYIMDIITNSELSGYGESVTGIVNLLTEDDLPEDRVQSEQEIKKAFNSLLSQGMVEVRPRQQRTLPEEQELEETRNPVTDVFNEEEGFDTASKLKSAIDKWKIVDKDMRERRDEQKVEVKKTKQTTLV